MMKVFILFLNKVIYMYKCICLIFNLYDMFKKRLVFEIYLLLNLYCVF